MPDQLRKLFVASIIPTIAGKLLRNKELLEEYQKEFPDYDKLDILLRVYIHGSIKKIMITMIMFYMMYYNVQCKMM